MSKQRRVIHPSYGLLPTDVEGFDSLAELALDMRWSWNHATDDVRRQLDPALWKIQGLFARAKKPVPRSVAIKEPWEA